MSNLIDTSPIETEAERQRKSKPPFSYFTQKRYPEPEAILDPTCDFEEMDRGEGMAVDDIKTYHRTEK
jgi:hypothetical protein